MSIRPYQGIHPTIAEDAYIDPQACVIGKVTIGSDDLAAGTRITQIVEVLEDRAR